MQNKRELGQYYTQENPFNHPLFKQWMVETGYSEDDTILEPFAGANNIPKLMSDVRFIFRWECFDIEPSDNNICPQYPVHQQDTIMAFPKGFKVCITNCPYLGKSSARRRKIDYLWEEDDLYKVCLNRMLANCDFVAAIIPESFITAGIHKDRLWGVISLTYKMFSDTECPVCLAMFSPHTTGNTLIYANDVLLGTMEELSEIDLNDTTYHSWVFNDPNGSIGVKTIDNQVSNDCKFFNGENIIPTLIKDTSRSFTRISGLPESIDRNEFISLCNIILEDYRQKTKDILMTSFKGLRSDGKYRRRLDFRTVRCILNKALKQIEGKPDTNLW